MLITPIIGLEVHIELKTKSKMFCGCNAHHFHVEPNTHTCPVCLGLPGALPVPNKVACEWCIKLGLALGCSINQDSFFERKNYFYPDLPKGYQITQLQLPFAINGKINIEGHDIRINRAHMEEDTGKSQHIGDETLLDFNRSGVPLVEIVSEPDIESPEEAKKYLGKIQQIVRYLGISDANIEEGSMRCEPTVNLKIEDNGQVFYTPLVEIKNVASLTGVLLAIQFEIDRQTEQFKKDGITKEHGEKTTRGWDADKSVTFLQREKEGSADYRYFPEPDIPPLSFTKDQIDAIRATLPELPEQKIAKYKALSLSDYDAELLAGDQKLSELYDQTLNYHSSTSPSASPSPSPSAPADPSPEFSKGTANLINDSVRKYINEFPDLPLKITPLNLAFAANATLSKIISSSVAKENVFESSRNGEDPVELAKKKGQLQISDTTVIEDMAKKIITDNPKAVADYKKNPQSISFLIGQLMKASNGSANPQLAKDILQKLLK